MWNKEDEKKKLVNSRFSSLQLSSLPAIVFSKWLLHKREAWVNLYKLVSAYNANQIVLSFFFFTVTTKEGQR